MTGFGLLAPSRCVVGLTMRGEVVADPFKEVLIYLWDEAVRAAGSGAVGSVFIGDLGGVSACCGLSARGSTLYLPLTGLEGGT